MDCFSRFISSGGSGHDPLDFTRNPTIDLEKLSLLFSNVSLIGDFQPESPWRGTNRLWGAFWPEADRLSTVEDLVCVFRAAVSELIDGHHVVAVSYSGGLDSFAVLREAAAQCAASGRRCIAVTADLIDDSGQSAGAAANALLRAFDIRAHHVIVPECADEGFPRWSGRGPRMEAMPKLTRAISNAAFAQGASLLLLGTGSDGLLGAPRYLLAKRRLAGRPRYLLDVLNAGATALGKELLGLVAHAVPPTASMPLYWAMNWPDLCGSAASPSLHERWREGVIDWGRDWIRRRLRSHRERRHSWSDAYLADCTSPCEVFPPSGDVPEASPFTHAGFVRAAVSLPAVHRYDGRYTAAYHRQKAIVLTLARASDRSADLPQSKQLFTQAYRRLHLGRAGRPDVSIELGLLDGDAWSSDPDPKVASRIQAIEAWLREALERGYSVATAE